MQATIEPLSERYFELLWKVADSVARERRYLAMVEAPPLNEAISFYRTVLAEGQCHVALDEAAVIGWCDVLPAFGESRSHVGTLGIGLLPAHRSRGLGRRLMKAAVDLAWQRGLSRIELTVRTDNPRARTLYERIGFQHEGVKRRSMRLDGVYFDCHAMALLREDDV